MYAICTMVLGVPMTKKVLDVINNYDYDAPDAAFDCDEPEDWGFETFYSGTSDIIPGYCGVDLFDIDPGEDYWRWSEVAKPLHNLTEEQRQEARTKFEALDPCVRAALAEDDITGPDIFLVWSTS